MRLRSRAHRPRKRFGQHFLEPVWAAKVVHAIGPHPHQTFVEIGPGLGAITGLLAAAAKRVVAFEIDRDLARRLRQSQVGNVEVVEGDFLRTTAESLRAVLGDNPESLRLVGNLPYNVAAPILFAVVRLFSEALPIDDATVMLQREVADRLVAAPGTRDYGVLTVLIGLHATTERLLQLPAGAFRPAPKVQSTLVRLQFHPPDPSVSNAHVFEELTRAIFTRRRKTLGNALRAYPPTANVSAVAMLELADLNPSRRPETLTIAELVRLSKVVREARDSESQSRYPESQQPD